MPADWKADQAESTEPLSIWDTPDARRYGLIMGSLHDFGSLTQRSIGIRLLLGGTDFPEKDTRRASVSSH